MDWHPDTNAAAQNFYPNRVKGRRLVGGANKTAIMRQKLQPLLRRYIRAYKKKHGIEPPQDKQRALLDNAPQLSREIEALESGIVVRVRHIDTCECKTCIAERPAGGYGGFLERQKALKKAEDEKARIAEEEERAYYEKLAARDELRSIAASSPVPRVFLTAITNGMPVSIVTKQFGVTIEHIEKLKEFYGD